MKLTVRHLMSTELVTLDVDESLGLAEEVMKLARVRHLPVVGDRMSVVGLVTHRDLLAAQASTLAGLSPGDAKSFKRSILVRDAMTKKVTTIEADAPALEAAKILRANRFGCLPVVEDGALVGIVTEADFLDLIIDLLDNQPDEEGERAEPPALN